MSIKANKDNAVFISKAYLQEDGDKASATVTFATNPIDGQNINLNGTVFTYRTTPAVANDVAVGASISASIDNLLTESLPATATYTKVGTDSIFIEYATIGTVGNSYTIASNFTAVQSSLSGGTDAPDADWVDNTPSIEYKLPNIVVMNDSTTTALMSTDVLVEGDEVRLYNGADGLVEGSLGTTTNIQPFVRPSGCIAEYKLNGNANDSVGTYNGTATNVTYISGKTGQAARFSGGSSYISIPNTVVGLDYNSPAYSISAWAYVVNGRCQIFGSGSGGRHVRNTHFSISNGAMRYEIFEADGNSRYNSTKSSVIMGNGWNHVVFIVDNYQSPKLYLNGSITATSKDYTYTSWAKAYEGGPYYIGSSGTSFGGTPTSDAGTAIDKFRIFNRALTAGEATTLYAEQLKKYTSDITSLGLFNPPTKAWLDKPITVSTVIETNEDRCIAQDETLSFVGSTLTVYEGTNAKSGLIITGDSIQLNGTTDVVCSNVVETDLGGGSYKYTCTIPSQASAPTSAKVLDRSIEALEANDTYDNVNEKFIKTYNKIEQQGRAMKYKIEADEGVEVTKVNIEMNKQG